MEELDIVKTELGTICIIAQIKENSAKVTYLGHNEQLESAWWSLDALTRIDSIPDIIERVTEINSL